MGKTNPLVAVSRNGTPIGKIQFNSVHIQHPDGSCLIPQPPDRKTSWVLKPFPGYAEEDLEPAVLPILQEVQRDILPRGQVGIYQWALEGS